MYLFVQTLVNMSTRESMQLQPKVTKCKSKERVVFSEDDTNLYNVLLQLQVLYLYLTIFFSILLPWQFLQLFRSISLRFHQLYCSILGPPVPSALCKMSSVTHSH